MQSERRRVVVMRLIGNLSTGSGTPTSGAVPSQTSLQDMMQLQVWPPIVHSPRLVILSTSFPPPSSAPGSAVQSSCNLCRGYSCGGVIRGKGGGADGGVVTGGGAGRRGVTEAANLAPHWEDQRSRKWQTSTSSDSHRNNRGKSCVIHTHTHVTSPGHPPCPGALSPRHH